MPTTSDRFRLAVTPPLIRSAAPPTGSNSISWSFHARRPGTRKVAVNEPPVGWMIDLDRQLRSAVVTKRRDPSPDRRQQIHPALEDDERRPVWRSEQTVGPVRGGLEIAASRKAAGPPFRPLPTDLP